MPPFKPLSISFDRANNSLQPSQKYLLREKKMNNAVDGINVLNAAIRTLRPQQEPTLTNLHAPLLALHLKTGRMKQALPYLRFDADTLFDDNYQPVRERGTRADVLEAQRQNGMTTGNYSQTFNQVINLSIPSDGKATGRAEGTGRETTRGLLKCKPVLLYFLYGAMIYGALERYDEALHLLEHIFNLPAARPSAIVIEGAKKYVLMSLIAGRAEPIAYLSNLPRAVVMVRYILPNIQLYATLESVYQQGITASQGSLAKAITDYVHRNYRAFERDNNIGLVKRLVVANKERAVKRLPKIFMTLREADLPRHVHMPVGQAKMLMQRMVQRGELQVRASGDGANRILHFDEPPLPAASDVAKCHEELDAALGEMTRLGNELKHFDSAVSRHPAYVERATRMGTGAANGDEGGGEDGANGHGMHIDVFDAAAAIGGGGHQTGFKTATPME